MLKRRNSPYASFDPAAPRNVKLDCTPTLLRPGRLTKPKPTRTKAPPQWSPDSPNGAFTAQS
jgi:hypothetical protein